jgi:integrase
MSKKIVSVRLYDRGGDLTKRWYGEVKFDDGSKERFWGINPSPNADERRAAYQRAKAVLESGGTLYTPKTIKGPAIIQECWAALVNAQGRIRPRTFTTYKSTLKVLGEWMADQKHQFLTPKVAEMYYDWRAKQGLNPTTLYAILETMGWYYTQMHKKCPFAGIQRPKMSKEPQLAFKPRQAEELCEWMLANDKELYLYTQICQFCFIRPKEILLLKVGDIDLKEAEILVRGSIAKNKKTLSVVIPNRLLDILKAHQIGERKPSEWLFPAIRDKTKALSYSVMQRRHGAMLDELRYDRSDYSLYSWKHTGNIRGIRAKVDVHTLMQQNRHASINQTQTYLQSLSAKGSKELREM